MNFAAAQRIAAAIDAELAEQAAWMVIQCRIQQSNRQPNETAKLDRALERFQRQYAGTPLTQRAKFEQVRINAAAKLDDDSIAQLEAIDRADPNWPSAQFEVVRLRHLAWLAVAQDHGNDSEAAQDAFGKLEAAAKRVFAEGDAIDDVTQAKARLLFVDAILKRQPPNLVEAQRLVESVQRTATSDAGNPSLVSDLNWQEFQLAKLGGDTDRANTLAEWLMDNSADPSAREIALLYLADTFDDRVKRAGPDAKRQAVSDALAFYRKISQTLGSDLETISRSQNAFVVLSRIAHYEVMSDELESTES